MSKLNNVEKHNIIGKILLNRYQISSWWRDGGLSSIFLLKEMNFNQNEKIDKIVKIIKLEKNNKTNSQKAFDELKLFKNHAYNDRHIVNLYDYYIDDNYLYLIIEKIEGHSLDELLKQGKIFNTEQAIFLILQLVKALKIMHTSYGQHPMIHRDIKPQNIIIDDKLKLTLIDFGISTMYDDQIPLTDEGDIFCSPIYSSPDILELNSNVRKGIKNNDEKMIKKFNEIVSIQLDIHSIGVILFQMITGKLPFNGFYNTKLTDSAKISLWKKYDIPLISIYRNDVPITIDNIIYKCTASRVDNLNLRYKNDMELETDLINALKPEFIAKSTLICPVNKRKYEETNLISHNFDNDKKSLIFSKPILITFSILIILLLLICTIITILYATKTI